MSLQIEKLICLLIISCWKSKAVQRQLWIQEREGKKTPVSRLVVCLPDDVATVTKVWGKVGFNGPWLNYIIGIFYYWYILLLFTFPSFFTSNTFQWTSVLLTQYVLFLLPFLHSTVDLELCGTLGDAQSRNEARTYIICMQNKLNSQHKINVKPFPLWTSPWFVKRLISASC